ncbi:MAG: Crp/Fnr family transcriptional regulator [Thiobacillus sp.]|nr:Crp/Fnr family transcriptional regulator [Thiobacillus sp.]
MNALEGLKRLRLFARLPDTQLARLARGTQVIHLERNDWLFRSGEPALGFYGIAKGKVLLGFPDSLTGDTIGKALAVINEGEMFCDAIAFLHTPYPVNAQAGAACDIVLIEREAIIGLIAEDEDFALKMFGHMSRAMEKLVYEVRDLKLSSASKRVACFLLHYAPKVASNSYEFTLPVQKQVVAARLNMSPAHFSRALRQLEQAEVIEVRGRNIGVLDAQRLKDLSS